MCPLWTKISFFCAQGLTFCITILFLFHLCALYIKTHSLVRLLFSELIHTQQEVKLLDPAFSSPVIWSVVFQILHFPGLAFSVAQSESRTKTAQQPWQCQSGVLHGTILFASSFQHLMKES